MINSIHDSQGIYILGDPFLRTFTTTFDYSGKLMDVGINVNAPSGAKITAKLSYLEIFFIVVGCLLVVACVGAVGYCILEKNKQKKMKERKMLGQGGYKGVWVRRESERLVNSDASEINEERLN